MTWVIEIDVRDVATGPLHGELAYIVSEAIDQNAPGQRKRVKVTWRPDPDCSVLGCLEVAEPHHTPCCSSHGRPLCCEHYCVTHFVEVNKCTPASHTPAQRDN